MEKKLKQATAIVGADPAVESVVGFRQLAFLIAILVFEIIFGGLSFDTSSQTYRGPQFRNKPYVVLEGQ